MESPNNEIFKLELIRLIKQDKVRMKALKAVASLTLPDCYIAAGFVRNLIWDHIHHFESTQLNDIDVIFYSTDFKKRFDNKVLEQKLIDLCPEFNWQIKNQAIMHFKNGDLPYKNTLDAITYWPEKETALALRLNDKEQIEVLAPFGLRSVFNGEITHNTNRTLNIFEHRLNTKSWLKLWPNLKVVI
ncbi:nucleotidyltransferase family protein [Pseudoalteromonas denitrificans]|uniref:Nucleotidyltransferase n=1 Tax=Pseudoalteromonas denitrificans DSM 6059 TaxID=1123010 RepID=A0A1I1UFG4_9GAMM|nr:nucleotidyltransferase family protein [Pseudoalteromonas denitrificans]SFD69582.1 hypothetical protein SAMN02745724_05221 [Pseudoalteromonas denitrificans DSM 6059]